MNPAVMLQLVYDLQAQLMDARVENNRLRAELAKAQEPAKAEPAKRPARKR